MSIRFTFLLLIMSFFAFVVPAQFENRGTRIDARPDYAKEVIQEINAVRKDPRKYASYLKNYLSLLRGDVLYLPNRTAFRLFEGSGSIKEAADALSGTSRTQPLTHSQLLDGVAASQLSDLLENPKLGHYGKDGADLAKRLSRFGERRGIAGENITFSDETPRQVALTMVIDDGVKSRMHRQNVLNPDYLTAGSACGRTADDKAICVTIFARRFLPLNPRVEPNVIEEFD